jgi:regulator of RNase E activity RraA
MSISMGQIHRPSKRLVDSFRPFNTGTICNALDRKGLSGAMLGLRAIVPGMQLLGCAVTVLETCGERGCVSPEDLNLAAIIEAVEPGDVAVIANNGHRVSSGGGVFGYALKAAGAAGVVVDGGVRDIEQIHQYQLPIFAKHVVPVTGKARIKVEAINQPIHVDSVLVRPGDIVLGDANGVVCIPQAAADEILALAEKQDSLDNLTVELMRQGLSFREAQARAGVR